MATVYLVERPDGWAHPPGEQGDGTAGFGQWLRRAREARGLTIDDITRETKIPARNLVALERGNLDGIPAFYQRAEVRAVARAIGVDERLALGRLDATRTPVVAPRDVQRPLSEMKLGLPAPLVALAFGVVMLTTAGMGRAFLDLMPPTQPDSKPRTTVGSGLTAAARAHRDLSPAPGPARAPAPAVPLPATATRLELVALAPPPAVTSETPAVTSEPPAVLADPPPADATESTGPFTEIVVTTKPSGAHVTVNGIGWGVSPVTIRHLPPGEKYIRATKEGFAATARVLALDDGQRESLNLRLAATE